VEIVPWRYGRKVNIVLHVGTAPTKDRTCPLRPTVATERRGEGDGPIPATLASTQRRLPLTLRRASTMPT
jgi:hypothetical protein